MKYKLLKFFGAIPLYEKLKQLYFKEMGVIFMLHRVHPLEENKLKPNENLKVSPEFLEHTIRKLKEEYCFISLDQLYDILTGKEKLNKKFALFTLDDGYKDNYEYAFPIFTKHNVPFTIYLTSDFPNKKVNVWWYIIEDLILDNKNLKLSDGTVLQCETLSDKLESFFFLRKKLLSIPKPNFTSEFINLFSYYSIDIYDKVSNMTLNWSQVIEMSKSELCTIGAHSVTHSNFNHLTKNELIWEIMESKKVIEEKIEKKVEHFSYPFGSHSEVNEMTLELMNELPFKTSTLSVGGKFYRHKNYKLTSLPRTILFEN
jgi:peptidoglycan/xylan/chitin deacetylase (PgdA/CDA1 family)